MKLQLFVWLLAISGTVCAELKRICYYTNWSQYRPLGAKFFPEQVDVSLCSHLIYAFSSMTGNRLSMYEWNDDTMFPRFQALKLKNPKLKTLLAVGGWNFGTEKMTKMLSRTVNMKEFINTSIIYLRKHGFDGLDFDFEYPAKRGSPAIDKNNFAKLVYIFRKKVIQEASETGNPILLLSAAVAAGYETIDVAYNVPVLSRHLDWIGLMSYDLHGSWDPVTGHHAGLYHRNDESSAQRALNVEFAANYWMSKGCPKEKLVIGIASYGRGFTLSNAANTGLGASARGGNNAGSYTREGGFLAYYEVCKDYLKGCNTLVWDEEQKVPYVFKGDQWVGFDNLRSTQIKAEWIKYNNFAGFMLWSLDLDDFTGNFCNEGKYPILKTLNNVFDGTINDPPATTTISSSNDGKDTTTTTTTTTTSSPTQNNGNGNTYGGGGSNFVCGVDNGRFPNTENCELFWNCLNGVRTSFTCPPTLWYNPLKDYCDYPANCPTDMMCIP